MDRNVAGNFNLIRLLAKEMIRNPRNEGGERESSSTLQGMRSFSAIESSIACVNGSGAMIAYSTAMAARIGDDTSSRPIPWSLRNPMCWNPTRTLRHSRNTRLRRHDQRSSQNDAVPKETRRSGGVRAAGRSKSDEEGERETIISNEMLNGCNIRLDGGIRSFLVCSITRKRYRFQ